MKSKFIKLNVLLFFITSLVFIVDLLLFVITDFSIKGYVLERYIYFYSIIIGIYLQKTKALHFDSNFKRYLKLSLTILICAPIVYVTKCGKLGSKSNIKLSNALSIRESVSLETMPAFSIYETKGILEKEKSNWQSKISIENAEYKSLSEIDSAKIIKHSKTNYRIIFYKNNQFSTVEFARK